MPFFRSESYCLKHEWTSPISLHTNFEVVFFDSLDLDDPLLLTSTRNFSSTSSSLFSDSFFNKLLILSYLMPLHYTIASVSLNSCFLAFSSIFSVHLPTTLLFFFLLWLLFFREKLRHKAPAPSAHLQLVSSCLPFYHRDLLLLLLANISSSSRHPPTSPSHLLLHTRLALGSSPTPVSCPKRFLDPFLHWCIGLKTQLSE